jgi:hypothetical protein
MIKPALIECMKLHNNTPPYEQVAFRIFDRDSNVKVCEVKMSVEEFTNLIMSGSTFKDANVEWNIDLLGKTMETDMVRFVLPIEHERKPDAYFVDKISLLKSEGWIFNKNDVGNEKFLIEQDELTKTYEIQVRRWV